jgi:aryl-alcohol dehydrogenase-like predicted oxidoreductase
MRTIPGTEIAVSPLALGGNVFGWSADEASSFAVLDAYLDAGGTMIDTADVYSAWLGTEGGESETIIGSWLAARSHRDRVTLATKVGGAPGYDNLQPATIRGALERSLTRLQTDYVDLYYAHFDKGDPVEGTLETFDALIREGKVRHVAVSNHSAARIVESLDASAAHGWASYVAVQDNYSLMERTKFEGEIAPLCLERGLGAFPYYGLARGYLTGKYRVDGPAIESVRAKGAGAYVGERGEAVLATLREVADAHAVPMPSVALAWLLSRPAVVAAMASARSLEQLAGLLPMIGLELSPDEIAALDAVSAT